jgi:RNA polymerase sigma factor (sigma-70 family)
MSAGLQKKDQLMLSRCIAGDKKAREKFVRKFSDLIYRSIQHILTVKHIQFNYVDLEDLHNSVFLALFEKDCQKLVQYKGINGCSLATWIRIVTVRIILNQIRKKGIDSIAWKDKQIDLDALPELKSDNPQALMMMEREEQAQYLCEQIEKLPPRDRLFLTLHFLKGLSIKEIAEVMQLSVENAYTVKHRAIKRLKSRVESDPGYQLQGSLTRKNGI